MPTAYIALGANIPGTWGPPASSLLRAVCELGKAGLHVLACSPMYVTRPIGRTGQPDYVNMVIRVHAVLGPLALLWLLKRLERQGGRRKRERLAARPLDLDLLDFGGRVIGAPRGPRVEGRLILPHPELRRRAFVLEPLATIAPGWRHPALGVGVRRLLAKQPTFRRDVRPLRGLCRGTAAPAARRICGEAEASRACGGPGP